MVILEVTPALAVQRYDTDRSHALPRWGLARSDGTPLSPEDIDLGSDATDHEQV
jgi:hypothetical protein